MRKIKSITSLLLTLLLLLSFTGCGEVKNAEKAVNGMFTAFKNADLEEAQKYVNVDDITNAKNESDENTAIILKAIFEKLDYEIISSEKIDDSTVSVKTKITAIDMAPVMTEYLSKVFEYAIANAFAEPQLTDDEYTQKIEEFLIECLSKPDLATVTNEVDIKVVKTENNEWKIETDANFLNALMGGLPDISDGLNEEFNSLE